MKPIWLVQDYSADRADELIHALRANNTKFYQFDKTKKADFLDILRAFPVVAYVTNETAEYWRKEAGVSFFQVYNYNCTTYFSHYWDDVLNQGMFLTYEMLRRSRKMVYEKFGRAGKIFIRPNIVTKSFTGKVVLEDVFIKETEYLDVSAEELILVAGPQYIEAEYRVVIADKVAITMSQYRLGEESVGRSNVQIPEVLKFAEGVVGAWQPDRVFVIDIAKTRNGLKVIELNPFTCSGLYLCDTDIIVRELNRIYET